MTVAVVVQARLDSSRLPKKALLDLGGNCILSRVLQTLKGIEADFHVLACDHASEETFKPIAEENGFICLAGPKEDVLERFCMAVRKTGALIVLRATGDNPYLFHEAARFSLERFKTLAETGTAPDYFTLTGLPHGSGVEVMDGRSLLRSATLTNSSYEREHVGPALYNHTDLFNCIFERAPCDFLAPHVRTTIDTREDYERSQLMLGYIQARTSAFPVSSSLIIHAWDYAVHPLVFIPSVEKGQGTGHLARTISLIRSLRTDFLTLLYIPEHIDAAFSIPKDVKDQVIHTLPEKAHMVILDRFRTTIEEMRVFTGIAPVIAIDEGGSGRCHASYLLDIIPSLPRNMCPANNTDHSYVPLPVLRKGNIPKTIKNALVVAGGENAAGLAEPAARMLEYMGYDITLLDPSVKSVIRDKRGMTISPPIKNLREHLCHYDLVVTHYGFTAFEAAAAGCRVALFSPTVYHYKLAKRYRFQAIPYGKLNYRTLESVISRPYQAPRVPGILTEQKRLDEAVITLITGSFHRCPLCGSARKRKKLYRFKDRSVAVCADCRMMYLHYVSGEKPEYSRSYFFEDYKKQYGKTYLEDFQSIRSTGLKRLETIDALKKKRLSYLDGEDSSLLDIGCAFGPFLDAAREKGWKPFGTDINEEAVAYVQNTLQIPASVTAFPLGDPGGFFDNKKFSIVTMWYVIEHFQDLESVFRKVRSMLRPGGLFAFSTPSVSGVSGFFSLYSFLEKSPRDHFSIWSPRRVKRQLELYGFTLQCIVSTGHHPERFPFARKVPQGSTLWNLLLFISRVFSLGDTFEVYATKNGSLEEDT